MKVREFTASQINAVNCAVSVIKKAKAGKSWDSVVSELAETFYNPERNGDAESQIKAHLQTSMNIFKASSGAYKGHVGQSPARADLLNDAKSSLGLNRRGRVAGSLSAEQKAEVNSLLADLDGLAG